MRIIIAGGSGLIGNALTHDLLIDKHEVIILSRNPQPPQIFRVEKIDLVSYNAAYVPR